jgi:RNA polymerase sigma-70 factor, ECF subfamily
MNPMISVNSIRSILSPCTGLRFAADGPGFDGRTVPMSLFAGTAQPQPSREKQVMDLYDQLRPSLITYLTGLGLNLNEAEDVIHDCFVRLYDHLAAKEDDENLRGWLFRVAHNLAMDVFREARRIQQPDPTGVNLLELMIDSSFSPEEHAIKNEEIRRVMTALGRLTPQQRAAVLLRAEELRYREIAAVLGVSTKRISELIQRALALLAGNL